MASQIQSPTSSSGRARMRRWLVGGTIVALLGAGYAIALHQLSREVGAGVEASLRTVPTLEDHHHRAAD